MSYHPVPRHMAGLGKGSPSLYPSQGHLSPAWSIRDVERVWASWPKESFYVCGVKPLIYESCFCHGNVTIITVLYLSQSHKKNKWLRGEDWRKTRWAELSRPTAPWLPVVVGAYRCRAEPAPLRLNPDPLVETTQGSQFYRRVEKEWSGKGDWYRAFPTSTFPFL